MGQRANYVLIEDNSQTIYYNHWRANAIAADLYLGERLFLDFVRRCEPVDVLLDEVWIEGCVVIDTVKSAVYFWSLELGYNSAVEYYLERLKGKWPGWEIIHVKNKMYDIERVLGIAYSNNFEGRKIDLPTAADMIADEVEDWANATVVLKSENKIHIVQTGSISVEEILNFGKSVTDVLLARPLKALYKENDLSLYKLLVIDTIGKKVIIDESEHGLLEQVAEKWEGYNLIMGDFGYIGALNLAKIDTTGLRMTGEEIIKEFNSLIQQYANFDSNSFAKELLKTDKNVQFNPNFFDTTRPSISLFEKLKLMLKSFLKG
ncbi:MAG: hypothetical protein V4577_15685 [Bacteroidota bacterium]